MKKVSLSFVNKVKVKNQVDWGKTYNMIVFKKKWVSRVKNTIIQQCPGHTHPPTKNTYTGISSILEEGRDY